MKTYTHSKRKTLAMILSVVVALTMIVGLIPTTAFATEDGEAKIGDKYYATFAAAANEVPANGTITVLKNITIGSDNMPSVPCTIEGDSATNPLITMSEYTLALKANLTLKNIELKSAKTPYPGLNTVNYNLDLDKVSLGYVNGEGKVTIKNAVTCTMYINAGDVKFDNGQFTGERIVTKTLDLNGTNTLTCNDFDKSVIVFTSESQGIL